jgi:hypothetical protein
MSQSVFVFFSFANTLAVLGFRKDFVDPGVVIKLSGLLQIIAALQTIIGIVAGAGTLLRDVLPRLRCEKCGEAPASVLLTDGGPAVSARRVWVLGGP